jgi:Rrf2 family nitric oxide-sensitive transcriptional repressor
MRLTVHSDYSLRVLMYLAAFPDRLATIEQIASAYGISQNHIVKVVQTLAHHGFIETLRGRNGGIRLALPTQEITVGAVVRATEESFDLVECFRTENTCCVTPVCSLQGALRDALEAFLHVLDEWTLAELVTSTSRRRLANLLTVN